MDAYIPQKSINIPIETERLNENIGLQFGALIQRFDPISLVEMDSVKLMNRVDTKFLLNIHQLPMLLQRAAEHYRVVEIDGNRILPYSSIYFDTDDTIMYNMHHNGKLNRYKIRMRIYVQSGLSFLEIKRKNNKGRTSKKRIEIASDNFKMMTFEANDKLFIHKRLPYSPESLIPQLQNYFQRITLVDKCKTERVTLDLGLVFKNLNNQAMKAMDDLVIVEMKQDGACKSFFREYLDELNVLPGSMSKYCLGMVLVNPAVKYNSFKKKLRRINKITQKNYVTV